MNAPELVVGVTQSIGPIPVGPVPGARGLFARAFRTLRTETPTVSLALKGELPPWLRGSLIRTAPAIFEVGPHVVNHWFDGFAMLYCFRFAAEEVLFTSRLLDSRSYREAQASGSLRHGAFATNPGLTPFSAIAARFRPEQTDNGNVSVSRFGNAMVALTETPQPIRFDPVTLETLGHLAGSPELAGHVSMAHPQFDPVRQCHYTYLLEFGRRSVYRLISINGQTGRQELLCTLDAPRPAYMHSIGMSNRFLIVAEFPLVVAPMRLMVSSRPFIRNYNWEPKRRLRFTVIDKDTGTIVTTADAPAAFGFHHVNAFEDGDTLAVDLIAFPDAGIIDQLTLPRLRAGAPVDSVGTLTRYRIPLPSGGAVTGVPLAETRFELPRIHDGPFTGQPYRWVWGAGCRIPGNFFDGIVKVDVTTGATQHWYEEGRYPGEPVFVGRPDGASEDDGVILSVIYDAPHDGSFLLVLDAATMDELARIEAPQPLPLGFHGDFFPASAMSCPT